MAFVRRLVPADFPALSAHFAALSPEDIRLRFGYAAPASQVEAHLAEISWFDWILLGCFEGGRLRGLLELVPLGEGKAELALTVHAGWRHRGLGTELCRRALILACNRRIQEVVMVCLTENIRMRRIVARLEGQILRHPGESEGREDLQRA